jgi:hypothetical protein
MTWIKKAYLYLVSLISLIIMIVAAVTLINMALKAWVFTKADDVYRSYPVMACPAMDSSVQIKVPECNDPDFAKKQDEAESQRRSAQRQSDAARSIAMIIVGAPVFYYHWKLARKEA